MVAALAKVPMEKYKPSIGKRWFLIILSSPIFLSGIAMFIVSWGWVLLRNPPAPNFDRIGVAILSFVWLVFAFGWLKELLKLIKETKK